MGISGSFSFALVACAHRTSSPLAHNARLNVWVCQSQSGVTMNIVIWMCAAQLHAMICKTNGIPIVPVHFIEFFIIKCKRRATTNTTTRSANSNCTLLHFYWFFFVPTRWNCLAFSSRSFAPLSGRSLRVLFTTHHDPIESHLDGEYKSCVSSFKCYTNNVVLLGDMSVTAHDPQWTKKLIALIHCILVRCECVSLSSAHNWITNGYKWSEMCRGQANRNTLHGWMCGRP